MHARKLRLTSTMGLGKTLAQIALHATSHNRGHYVQLNFHSLLLGKEAKGEESFIITNEL